MSLNKFFIGKFGNDFVLPVCYFNEVKMRIYLRF